MQTEKKRASGYKKLLVSAVPLSLLFIILLLSIIILLNSALGWFAYNSITNAGRDEIVVTSGDAFAEYECYVYNVLSNSVGTQTIDDLNMQPYDMIFDKRNRYTPAIIRISLTDIRAEYSSMGTLNITISRDTSLPNNVLNDYFSSVMRFTAAVGNSYYSADSDTLYSNIDAALYTAVKEYPQNYSSASSKTFTTVTGGTGTDLDPYTYRKADSITLSVPYTSSDKNGDILNVYLYLSYDLSLIYKYRAAEGIDTSSTVVGRTSTMFSDIKLIKVAIS